MITANRLLRQRLRALRAEQPDAGAAMVMTIAFMVLTAGLMLALLAVLVAQLQPMQVAQKNSRTVYAAQAGIQAALSVMRTNTKTVNGVLYGDPSKLPATLTGTVDGTTTSTLKYSVSITYFTTSPSGKNATWLAANQLSTWTTQSTQPSFARIVSTGSDAAVTGMPAAGGNRTVVAIYAFKTTNVNIPGGLILTADATKCLMADSATTGSKVNAVSMASCTVDARDLWVYDTDYKLKLASTIGTATVLCTTGEKWLNTTLGYDSTAADVTLQPCGATNAAAYGNQLWSWDSPDSWQGENKANSARSTRWLGLSSNRLIDTTASGKTFAPQAAVGAGGARKATNQIVNYKEFGRCMDVTKGDINHAWMIVYPCKQDPAGDGANLYWNHRWFYTEPTAPATTSAAQNITVVTGSTYCLTGSTTSVNVTFTACSGTNAMQQFVRNTETGSTLSSWTFQLAGDRTRCLTSVAWPTNGNPDGESWSTIQLVACSGSTTQKWNAPAVTSGSTLGDYQEIG